MSRYVYALAWVLFFMVIQVQAYTVYVQHPWSTDATRSAQPLFLFGPLTGTAISASNQMSADPIYIGWYKLVIPEQAVASGDYFQIVNYKTPATNSGKTTFSTKFLFEELFASQGEAWISIAGGKATVTASRPVQSIPRNIYFVSPWEAGGVNLLSADSVVPMISVDTLLCGWFKAVVQIPDTQTVLPLAFMQNGGTGVYGTSGLGDLGDIAVSLAQGGDLWIRPASYPAGTAVIGENYGGTLGACRHTLLRASVWDWSKTSNTSFGSKPASCPSGGSVPFLGGVLSTLGADGKPQYSGNNSCNHANVADWYKTVSITGAGTGKSYTNQRCINLPLSKDVNDLFRYETDRFFVVDDWMNLDALGQDPNPNYSLETAGVDGLKHNFLYSMELGAEFEYVPGQTFSFRGDDDVWVFINGKLVVDIGGIHSEVEASVNLDTLGLTPGATYPFKLFFAERKCCSSNFKMVTSIDLRSESAISLQRENLAVQKDKYTVLQTRTTQGSSCEMNTVVGSPQPSSAQFVLTGTGLSAPQTMGPGVHFGGIEIFADETGFVIDVNAIMASTGLPPGRYTVSYALRSDATLKGTLVFDVPSYEAPAPELRLLRLDSTVIALGDTLSSYKGGIAKILVEALQEGSHCGSCNYSLVLSGSSVLEFLPGMGAVGDTLRMENGWAVLGLRGKDTTSNGQMRVQGPFAGLRAEMAPIVIRDAGLPVAQTATIWDDNGDGRADKLVLDFDRKIASPPHSLLLRWPVDGPARALNLSEAQTSDGISYTWKDSLFSQEIRTQGAGRIDVANGLPDGGLLETSANVIEYIGAVIIEATTESNNQAQTLEVRLSEPLVTARLDSLYKLDGIANFVAGMFNFELPARDRNQVLGFGYASWNSAGDIVRLISVKDSKRIPRPGDKIKLVAQGNAYDLLGNLPHSGNPWVVIRGVADAVIESNKFAQMDDQPYTAEGTTEIFYAPGPTLKEIAIETGRPGYLLDLDLQQYLHGDSVKPADIGVEWTTYIHSNTGSFVRKTAGTYSCADSAFGGNCSQSDARMVYLAWDMHSQDGRKAGSGVYIVQLYWNIKVRGAVLAQGKRRELWGVVR